MHHESSSVIARRDRAGARERARLDGGHRLGASEGVEELATVVGTSPQDQRGRWIGTRSLRLRYRGERVCLNGERKNETGDEGLRMMPPVRAQESRE